MSGGDFLTNMAASSRARSLSAQAVTPARELRDSCCWLLCCDRSVECSEIVSAAPEY